MMCNKGKGTCLVQVGLHGMGSTIAVRGEASKDRDDDDDLKKKDFKPM